MYVYHTTRKALWLRTAYAAGAVALLLWLIYGPGVIGIWLMMIWIALLAGAVMLWGRTEGSVWVDRVEED